MARSHASFEATRSGLHGWCVLTYYNAGKGIIASFGYDDWAEDAAETLAANLNRLINTSLAAYTARPRRPE